MLKRFEASELGESASRRVSYHCTADYAKSSKAKCRVCETNIDQNELRLALMLQDIEGYKNTAWTHFDCFWKHPETKRLCGTHEMHNFAQLKADDRNKISIAFKNFNAKKATSEKKDNDGRDDQAFSPDTMAKAKKVAKKNPVSKKRKRDLDDE